MLCILCLERRISGGIELDARALAQWLHNTTNRDKYYMVCVCV